LRFFVCLACILDKYLLIFEKARMAFFIVMSKFILAKKVNMTQIFGEDGVVHAATILNVEPATISQIKTKEKDGYDAVQIGSGVRKGKNISKAVRGQIKSLEGMQEGKIGFGTIKEFRTEEGSSNNYKRGDKISVETFAVGDKVQVSAVSKGKGFQGVVKRHGFHGGPRSHGQKHSEREPGSIGGGGRSGGKVIKGMRMAGRTGGDRITVKNLKVLEIDAENNTMIVLGAVPGRKGTLVEVKV
jgi:large subunit ribosomal protein L3